MKYRVAQEISFEVEADSKFQALEEVGEHMLEMITNKQFLIDGAFYAEEIDGAKTRE